MLVYPCKDCERRALACHDTCEDFKKVQELNEKIKEQQRRESVVIDYFRRGRLIKSKNKHTSKILKGHKK